MLRKIKLYGELAKFLGEKTLEAEVNNAAQAIRYSTNQVVGTGVRLQAQIRKQRNNELYTKN